MPSTQADFCSRFVSVCPRGSREFKAYIGTRTARHIPPVTAAESSYATGFTENWLKYAQMPVGSKSAWTIVNVLEYYCALKTALTTQARTHLIHQQWNATILQVLSRLKRVNVLAFKISVCTCKFFSYVCARSSVGTNTKLWFQNKPSNFLRDLDNKEKYNWISGRLYYYSKLIRFGKFTSWDSLTKNFILKNLFNILTGIVDGQRR